VPLACFLTTYDFEAEPPRAPLVLGKLGARVGYACDDGAGTEGDADVEFVTLGGLDIEWCERSVQVYSYPNLSLKNEHLQRALASVLVELGAFRWVDGERTAIDAEPKAWLDVPWPEVSRWRKLWVRALSVSFVIFGVPVLLIWSLVASPFRARQAPP
jgi:hypothetical protein